jgi:hypothetical protein
LHRLARLLPIASITLAGCGKLDEAEACDLAVDWIEQKGFPTVAGGSIDEWEFDRCDNFRSKTEDGEAGALIDVVVSREVAERTPDGEVDQHVAHNAASCVLVKYDQGWSVEACLPI